MKAIHHLLLLLIALASVLAPAGNAVAAARCDSCLIQVTALDDPVKLAGYWQFTRDDDARNKNVDIDTSTWKRVKAPGPWKSAYGDGQVFPVGWYRGTVEFDPSLIGQEVVLLVNAHVSRLTVYVDGRPIFSRPDNINVSRYYAGQPVPARFKVTQAKHLVAIRIDTPLMMGIYQMPFELRKYDQHDLSLVLQHLWAGELRMIVGFVAATFGLFFLSVYAKTRYGMYLVAGLSGVIMLPFFIALNDYFFRVFEPETLLYWHYVGLVGIFFFFPFSQYFHQPMPRLNWGLGITMATLAIIVLSMTLWPNLRLFQAVRSVLLVSTLVAGVMTLCVLMQAVRSRQQGARPLFAAMLCFLAAGFHDVLLALGLIESIGLIFAGSSVFVAAMLFVASNRFAGTFLHNKRLVKELKGLNDNLEGIVDERTEQLRCKTQDIQNMMQNLPQGVLTITRGLTVHREYSAHLEVVLQSTDIGGRPAMQVLFSGSTLGADALSQIEASLGACIGEDLMNFDFNAHLLPAEVEITRESGASQSLALSWSPVTNEQDQVEKLLVCVRDVTTLKRLASEAGSQRRELAMIGEILQVSQEKFHEFIEQSTNFLADNVRLLNHPPTAEVVNLLFRNMHTIKGNARTYGLLHLTNLVHEAEQTYDELRQNPAGECDAHKLKAQAASVQAMLDEYTRINTDALGRQGPGRRQGRQKYLSMEKEHLQQMLATLSTVNQSDADELRRVVAQVGSALDLLDTQRLADILSGPLESLPSLARELGKEPPSLSIEDHGLVVRSKVAGLLKNVFAHLLRNAMDHGLESAEERLAQGKAAAGRIEVKMYVEDGKLRVTLGDDGRGMALDRIRQRAVDRGLVPADVQHSPAHIAQFIFLPGFSTAEKVTEVSGRGVGMDAVKGFLEQDGGSVEIRFVDTASVAGYRAFVLVLSLPDEYVASVDASTCFEALRQRVKSTRQLAAPAR